MLSTLFQLAFLALSVYGGRPYDVYTLCTSRGFAYTWDDGPWIYQKEIADTFKSFNASTTFFVNGNAKSCIYDEENVKRIRHSFEAGHQIASHTWSHASLVQLTDEQIDAEVQRLDQALIRILGVKPKFIRPPFGDLNDHVISYLRRKHNKIIIMWSDDSGDATGGTTQGSIDFYTSFAHERPDYPALTLSHEVSDAGVEAMRNGTVRTLTNAGVQLLTVAQCIDQEPYEYVGCYQKRDESWTCDDKV